MKNSNVRPETTGLSPERRQNFFFSNIFIAPPCCDFASSPGASIGRGRSDETVAIKNRPACVRKIRGRNQNGIRFFPRQLFLYFLIYTGVFFFQFRSP